MSTGMVGGLTGKARRVHRQCRADRRYADLLIEEYLEPESPLGSADRAPIRGRPEFMPSYMTEALMVNEQTKSQMELPWDERRGATRWHDESESVARHECTDDDAADEDTTTPKKATVILPPIEDDSGVIRIPRRSRVSMPIGWAHEGEPRETQKLSLRGFGVGCAIGSVAAAAALIVIRVAVG